MLRKPFDLYQMFHDEKELLFSALKSGAQHEDGVMLTQKQCQFLEYTLMRSVDITTVMESVSEALKNTIIDWKREEKQGNESHD